jgi:hypothetical protein
VNIFLPFKKDANPYLDEIINHSEHAYFYDSFENYKADFKIVNIHWPEAIFNWKEPSHIELKELEDAIALWKLKSLLVYTKHDFHRNKGTTKNFTRLFRLIEENTDVFIHLGKFSRDYYQEKYPKAKHKIIYHPLYTSTFKFPDQIEARKILGVNKDAVVIIAPGNIRNYEERDMFLKAFKSLKIKNKVLICTNVHSEIRHDFPGRSRLKRVVDIKRILKESFRKKHQPPEYLFSYTFIPQNELELKMAAADIVLIPRINTLNSGNVFLGLSFEKKLVGPQCGNIKEQLEEFNFPVFDSYNRKSVLSAVKKCIELPKPNYLNSSVVEKYRPENVSACQDALFNELKSK